MKTLSFVAVLIFVWFAYQRLYPLVVYPPGVLVASGPVQTDASPDEVPLNYGKFQLKALLSRTDTGNGACELVWVEEVEQLTH